MLQENNYEVRNAAEEVFGVLKKLPPQFKKSIIGISA